MKDQDSKTPDAVFDDSSKIKADAEQFLKITKDSPPTQKKAVEKFELFIKILENLDLSQWKRFFAIVNKKETPNELALTNPAIAAINPADHAYYLMLEIGELDVAWWNRYWKRITKVLIWLVGLPLVGKAIEWVIENWDKLLLSTQTPTDIFQTKEYVFLSLTGLWIASLVEIRKLH